MIDGIPIPDREGPFERGFWLSLDRGVLSHQRCAQCRRWHFPPRYQCDACGSDLAYEPVSGRGRLWSFTVVHAPVLPAFSALTPFVAAVVELDEQVGLRMAGNIVRRADDPINAVTSQDLKIGMPLRAVIRPLADGVPWPRWTTIEDDQHG